MTLACLIFVMTISIVRYTPITQDVEKVSTPKLDAYNFDRSMIIRNSWAQVGAQEYRTSEVRIENDLLVIHEANR